MQWAGATHANSNSDAVACYPYGEHIAIDHLSLETESRTVTEAMGTRNPKSSAVASQPSPEHTLKFQESIAAAAAVSRR